MTHPLFDPRSSWGPGPGCLTVLLSGLLFLKECWNLRCMWILTRPPPPTCYICLCHSKRAMDRSAWELGCSITTGTNAFVSVPRLYNLGLFPRVAWLYYSVNTLSKGPKQLLEMWKLGLFPGEGDDLQDVRKEEGLNLSACFLFSVPRSICHPQRKLHSNGEKCGRPQQGFSLEAYL